MEHELYSFYQRCIALEDDVARGQQASAAQQQVWQPQPQQSLQQAQSLQQQAPLSFGDHGLVMRDEGRRQRAESKRARQERQQQRLAAQLSQAGSDGEAAAAFDYSGGEDSPSGPLSPGYDGEGSFAAQWSRPSTSSGPAMRGLGSDGFSPQQPQRPRTAGAQVLFPRHFLLTCFWIARSRWTHPAARL